MEKILDDGNAYLGNKKSFYDIVDEKKEITKKCKEHFGMSINKTFAEAKLDLSRYIKKY